MRVDAQVMERDPGVARVRMIGAIVAGVLPVAGCDMVTVVREEAPSDCAELAERAGTEII